MTAIASFLRKPLFGTLVNPRDATVDPALFPEDHYPVFCTKCGYCLRGLPDGKCPECGTTFARGQLLVRTYVKVWSGVLWRDSAARKWVWRFIVTGYALPVVAILGFEFMKYFRYFGYFDSSSPPSPAALDSAIRLQLYVLLAIFLAGPLFLFGALVIAVKTYPRGSWKRRRAIIDAIKQANAGRKYVRGS